MTDYKALSPTDTCPDLASTFSVPAFHTLLACPLDQPSGLKFVAEHATLPVGSDHFSDDLRQYIRYRKECDGKTLSPASVNFEDFMAFLDVEFRLGLRGSDTSSEHGNETQVAVKTLIGEILTERTPQIQNVPDLYLRFARMLQPRDMILTFNYDILLERALESIGRPYRLVPNRLVDVHEESATIDTSKDDEEVIVLKLHRMRRLVQIAAHTPYWMPNFDRMVPTAILLIQCSIPGANSTLTPLVEGPSFESQSPQTGIQAQEIERLYRMRPMFMATPLLLNPSGSRLCIRISLGTIRAGLGHVGYFNSNLAIIGYSMPQEDNYARQVIYRIVRNFQRSPWVIDKSTGRRKEQLVLINLRQTDAEIGRFVRTYAFINLRRTAMHLDGFNDAAIDLVSTNNAN